MHIINCHSKVKLYHKMPLTWECESTLNDFQTLSTWSEINIKSLHFLLFVYMVRFFGFSCKLVKINFILLETTSSSLVFAKTEYSLKSYRNLQKFIFYGLFLCYLPTERNVRPKHGNRQFPLKTHPCVNFYASYLDAIKWDNNCRKCDDFTVIFSFSPRLNLLTPTNKQYQ